MKNTKLLSLVGRFFWKPKNPEVYIGDCSLFKSGQKTLDRYGDFSEIGRWGVAHPDGKGGHIITSTGKMLAETVKFVGKDGVVKLGRDWIRDDDERVTRRGATASN